MNDRLQKILAQVKDYFAKMSVRKRVILGIAVGTIAIGAVGVGSYINQDPYQVLYSDLNSEEARSVAKKLAEQKIPYRMGEDQRSISVVASRVHEARMQLAQDGLPGQDVVGFEKFDATTFGMSSYVQRIQYVRAVQGELTRSIQRLSAVKRARVHISIPPKKTFLEEEDAPKASVILELKPGQSPSKQEVNGIAHLVASAVEGLKVNQVTIVDTRGSFLHRPENDSTPGVSLALMEMQRNMEGEYEKRIQDILTPLIGLDKVRAKVTVEVDPTRSNTTEESYDPERAVARTSYKVDETNEGKKPNPIGIPGSRSNLPGTEVDNPSVPMATNNNKKNTENMSFAVPRKVQIVDKPSGSIKRLTVAVVVDGQYETATDGKPTNFVPRPEEELKRIQELVANTVGFDPERRDSITVSSMPFKPLDSLEDETAIPVALDKNEIMRHAIRNGLIGLVLLTFFFFLVRPWMKWSSTKEETQKSEMEKAVESEIAVRPRTVAEIEAGVVSQSELMPGGVATAMFEEMEPMEKKEGQELKKKLEEKMAQSSGKGLRIIQEWLEETAPTPMQEAS